MSKSTKYNTESFIHLSRQTHDTLYDYSKCIITTTKVPVCIIDPDFGEFWQNPVVHANGGNHPTRAKQKSIQSRNGKTARSDNVSFTQKAISVHGEIYDYSKIDYKNATTKICIIDPAYGEFFQTPNAHLCGQGHPKRGSLKAAKKRRLGVDEFILRAREKHGDLYEYSKIEYINVDTKVCITHPILGDFWQTPYEHMAGSNHPKMPRRDLETDHILPLSLAFSGGLRYLRKNSFEMNRPLVQFLLSEKNTQILSRSENASKSDFVVLRGKSVKCSSVRNVYAIIYQLCLEYLNEDIQKILKDDEMYIRFHFIP
jgi:hypothetical protein